MNIKRIMLILLLIFLIIPKNKELQIKAEDYVVSVTGDIPTGTGLSVRELAGEEYEKYKGYVEDAVGEEIPYCKLLDISLGEYDNVEADVSIKILDQPNQAGSWRVVHFPSATPVPTHTPTPTQPSAKEGTVTNAGLAASVGSVVKLLPEDTPLSSEPPLRTMVLTNPADAGTVEESQNVVEVENIEIESVSDNTITFHANSFSIYGVFYVITTKYLTADGQAYNVTVSYERGALPEGAKLLVREITSEGVVDADGQIDDLVSDTGATTGDAGGTYDNLVASTEAALGLEEGSVEYIRFFDITIVDGLGEKIQPAGTVDVRIELADAESQSLSVVHFADDDNPEVLDCTTEGQAVSFEAGSFSVYAVVSNPEDLDGKSFGILNTTDVTSPTGVAMTSTAQDNGTKLQGKSTTVRIDPIGRTEKVYVANNSNIQMWTFTRISGDQYYISTVVGGSLKYLKLSSSGVSLVDEPENDCKITVKEGTTEANKGKFRFSNNNGSIQKSGSTFVRNASANRTNPDVYMSFAELSNLNDDDFVVYTAEKVSVSGTVTEDETGTLLSDGTRIIYDINDGDQVILYTRIWNEATLRYDYYAIDYDGMLVKAYESGDTISWVGSKVNTMLWNFTEHKNDDGTPKYYYELQNDYSEKYIAPRIIKGENGELLTPFLSDGVIGLNLNGRRYKEYYSTVLAWDDPYYDYATLTVNGYQLAAGPMSKASDFYFAKMTATSSGNELTRVATIDSQSFGITMKMQDYDGYTTSGDYRNPLQNEVVGTTPYVQYTGTADLLSKNLGENGYPVSKKTNQPLSRLYDGAMEVNNLFLLNTYQETGYFEYDCTQNFAHLITNQNDKWYHKEKPSGGLYEIGDFVVYNQLGTTSDSGATRQHGQFFPYNDLTEGYFVSWKNETDIHAYALSSLDPRKGEKLYKIQAKKNNTAPDYVDHFFGMEMSASFMQSESGLDAWGHDLIFEFSGDDDFWLYVDDMLVLDLGGIHQALDGSVNFRTGDVTVWKNQKYQTTTLRKVFEDAYKEKHPTAGNSEIEAWLNGIFKDGGTVFKDFSGHTMKMFYMERGAGASNLHMRFNLTQYIDGEVQLEKKVSGTDNVDNAFPFQVWVKDRDRPDDRYFLWGQEEEERGKVTDLQTGQAITYQDTYEVDGLTYKNVFFLKPGQIASIKLPSEETEYYIKECALDTNTYDEVKVNGVVNAGTAVNPELYNGTTVTEENPVTGVQGLKDYKIESSTVNGRKKVIYDNHVSDAALKSLYATKRLWQDEEMTVEINSDTDNTEFTIQIFIGEGTDKTVNGTGYAAYSTGKYYVKNPDGYYCYYDNGFKPFVKDGQGVRDLSFLSTVVQEGQLKSELERATYYTSPGGYAERIMAGYSFEIPGLLAGTPFLVEETGIPTGYKLLGYTRTTGEYSNTEPLNTGTAVNYGTIGTDDLTVSVHNQHGYGLKVKKAWSDADFMDDHDEIYFAVYRKDGENQTLLLDTLRQLGKTDTNLTWFFPELDPDKNLNDYLVYEVMLGIPDESIITTDGNGFVTGYTTETAGTETLHQITKDNIIKIDAGQTLTAGGHSNEHGYSQSLEYTASYDREVLEPNEDGEYPKVRTDTVKNTRPGIKIVKTDMTGTALEDGVFELGKGEYNRKTFSSDENGLIAMAYLSPNENYTLTELRAPYGYQALIDSVTIKTTVEDEKTVVYVNGSEDGNDYYAIDQVDYPTAENMPTITIKNKYVKLEAVKIDAYTGLPMAGVKFSLYKQVYESANGVADYDHPMPDYNPMEDYEDLITDENGIIPKVVLRNTENPNGLKAGTYYLKEETPSGYVDNGIYIQMTISPTGEVTLKKAVRPTQSGHWRIVKMPENLAAVTEDTRDGIKVLKIDIKNTPKEPVRIKKYEMGTTKVLKGVEFKLYGIAQVEDGKPEDGAEPIITGVTDEDGILLFSGLEENTTYYLFETKTLDGYNLLSGPVTITTVGSSSVTAYLNGSQLKCEKVRVGGRDVWEITVYNSAGVELPATGGHGPRTFYYIGLSLMIISGAYLKKLYK